MKNPVVSSLFTIALVTTQSFAYETDKPVKVQIAIQKSQSQEKPISFAKKQVVLEGVRLTAEEKKVIFTNIISKHNLVMGNAVNLPQKINLGMNGVPVLDQGQHGAVAAFATTAAIDAVLGKGDYISQLCHLELSHFISDYSYSPNGWSSASVSGELNQLMTFGIVSKTTQQLESCAGIKEYPSDDMKNEGNLMSLPEYKEKSEAIHTTIRPELLLATYDRLHGFTEQKADAVLMNVKQALAKGHRLAFKTLLMIIFDDEHYCEGGVCASFHSNKDTWAFTKALQNINPHSPTLLAAAHALVITGYDDKAIATDNEGNTHQGLLTLRNSWGPDAGDHGDYYMTYDYFKQFAMEVYEIVR